MAEHSTIGWTDATWPIVAGCDYVSPGCSNCWAVRDSWRLMHSPYKHIREAFAGVVEKLSNGKLVWTGLVRPLPFRLDWPLKWHGAKKIFVCSQADLWHPKVPFEFIAAAFGVAAMSPQHTLQFLTKHTKRMREFFAWLDQQQGGALETCLWHARKVIGSEVANRNDPYPDKLPKWPLANAWLGVTVEDQQRAEERIPDLLRTPAAKRWLSVEPMLEAIDLTDIRTWEDPEDGERGHKHELGDIDWVVCGGESAQTRETTRPFDVAWAHALRDQCEDAGVAFFMKQLGTVPLWNGMSGPGSHWPRGTRTEDTGNGIFRIKPPIGKSSRYKFHEPEHWPEDLRVQEFPA